MQIYLVIDENDNIQRAYTSQVDAHHYLRPGERVYERSIKLIDSFSKVDPIPYPRVPLPDHCPKPRIIQDPIPYPGAPRPDPFPFLKNDPGKPKADPDPFPGIPRPNPRIFE